MKKSKFNFFEKREDGSWVAFNAATGALGILSQSGYEIYESQTSLTKGKITIEKREVIRLITTVDDMKKGGFILDDDFDELKNIEILINRRKFDSSSFGLTIMPTSDCNLHCPYCYETKNREYMDKSVQDELVTFVEKRLEDVKYFGVSWYGGEPLLAVDTIVELTDRFLKLCSQHNCEYHAGIITNGVLLTEENAKKLSDSNITFVQISLDGTKEIHNKTRYSKGNKGTFDTIIENIKNALDILPSIYLRINLNKDNVSCLDNLLDYLASEGLKNKIQVYVGQIEPIGAIRSCNDITTKCIVDGFFAETYVNFNKTAIQKGWDPEPYLVPATTFGLCAAEMDNAFVVEPNGDLQKCWVPIGDEKERVGNLRDGVITSGTLNKWIGYSPLDDPECRECDVLPLCYGNCVYRNLLEPESKHCGVWKYQLGNVLKEIDNYYPAKTRKTGIESEMNWLSEPLEKRKRCCFIVCGIRCSKLHPKLSCNKGSCKPVSVCG
jgi:uncharacterized protein